MSIRNPPPPGHQPLLRTALTGPRHCCRHPTPPTLHPLYQNGIFLAAPINRMGLFTLPELYARKYGPLMEVRRRGRVREEKGKGKEAGEGAGE